MVCSIKGIGPNETIYFIGTIILAEPQFCYIVVDRCMVKYGFSYEATLPDGSVVPLLYDNFLIAGNGGLAAVRISRGVINYNVGLIKAVQFEEDEVSRFKSVRLADFDEGQNIFFPAARVNDVVHHFFMLDWSTKNIGAPVFSEAGAVVGICYQSPLEPSYAYTLEAIKSNLFELSEVPVQTLEELLDQMRLRGAT